MKIVLSPRARQSIARIDQWWVSNRHAAPDLFLDELRQALDLLGRTPQIGLRYRQKQDVRRLLLPNSSYHIYYEIKRDTVRVLVVWSAVRARGPRV